MVNMLELMQGIRSILEACEAVKPKEHVLVVTDNEGGPMWMGQLIVTVISSMDAEAVQMVITTPMEQRTQEPPALVAAAMKSVNAIFWVSNRSSPVHSTARKQATAAGARYYSMGRISLDDLKQGVSVADIQLIKKRTESLAQRLTQASVVKVTTPLGTDITMSLAGREGLPLNPASPILAGLPYFAEAPIAPVEGTAEGIMVVDLSVTDWGYLLREPLHCTVKAGKLVAILGSTQDADRLRKAVATDENASNIAEFSIGTSHIIPRVMSGLNTDKGRLGLVHIGIGRNDDIGGKTLSRFHTDLLMSQPTVELDDQCVVRDGALLI